MIKDDPFEDKKRPVPEAFRVSLDASDTEAHARLVEADRRQREIAAGVSVDFTQQTPHARQRQKAIITIETLEAASIAQGLTEEQIEILAEAYATIGRYDKAATLSLKHADLYRKYWDAVYLDDDEWCEHVDKHKYVSEIVWSFRDQREAPLLACNICGTWNVADAPEHLTAASKRRAAVRQAAPDPNVASIAELREWHQANVKH